MVKNLGVNSWPLVAWEWRMNCRATNVDFVADFVRLTRDIIEINWNDVGLKKCTTETLVLSRLYISGYTQIRSCVVLDLGTDEAPKNWKSDKIFERERYHLEWIGLE